AEVFKDKQSEVCVIDSESNELKSFATEAGITYVSHDEELTEYLEKLIESFIERNKRKKELVTSGAGEKEIYSEMLKKTRIAVIINDLEHFINTINTPLKSSKYDFKSVVVNLLEKGYLHNIFFISGLTVDSAKILAGNRLFTSFIADKNGILLGGGAVNQNVFDFSSMKFSEQNKVYKPGIGLISTENAEAVKVIIPSFASGEEGLVE
ncbi:MAG: hypothetical protein IJH36_11755, partial [Clostridia bacterium]|nr:hypothetical protein [Clostridia bacterium]